MVVQYDMVFCSHFFVFWSDLVEIYFQIFSLMILQDFIVRCLNRVLHPRYLDHESDTLPTRPRRPSYAAVKLYIPLHPF
jgi:hypothetical protein